jgi:hypothetical protein
VSIASIVASGRRLIQTSLLDTCWVQDRTVVRDGTGGRGEVFTERGASIACRFVQPKENDPILQLDSVFGRVQMILEVAIGTNDFQQGDRIRNDVDSGIWRVVTDITPPSVLATVARYGISQEVI